MPYGLITTIVVDKCPDCDAAVGYPIHDKHTSDCPRIALPKGVNDYRDDLVRAAVEAFPDMEPSRLRDAIGAYSEALAKWRAARNH